MNNTVNNGVVPPSVNTHPATEATYHDVLAPSPANTYQSMSPPLYNNMPPTHTYEGVNTGAYTSSQWGAPAPRPVQQATDPMQAMISTMLSNPMMAKFVSNPMFAKTFSGIVQQHLGQLQASAGVKAAHPISPTMPAQPVQPAAQAAQTAAQPAQQSFNPFQAMTQQQQPQMPAFNPFSLFNMG